MPLQDVDKYIKQVTESGSPIFKEGDWKKMQILLDEHLPVKKDRQRLIVLFFFIALLGSLTALFLFGTIKISGRQDSSDLDNQPKKIKDTNLLKNRQTVLEDTQENTHTISRTDLGPHDKKSKTVI